MPMQAAASAWSRLRRMAGSSHHPGAHSKFRLPMLLLLPMQVGLSEAFWPIITFTKAKSLAEGWKVGCA